MPNATQFADATKRMDHYVKHKDDFGATSPTEYEALAATFLNRPLASNPDIEERCRQDGDAVRYDKVTNEFAICKSDGTIVTYYKPMMRSMAPPGYPRIKTHNRSSNYQYFLDEAAK